MISTSLQRFNQKLLVNQIYAGSRFLWVKPDVDSTQEYQGERTTKCIVNSGKIVSSNFNNPKAATNNTSAVMPKADKTQKLHTIRTI